MINAILLDIEGTTTPIDFVHKTLFPYAKQRIREYVAANWSSVTDEVRMLKGERSADEAYEQPFDKTSPSSVSDYLEFLIDSDRKSTPLKSLQGKIWQRGYEAGDLKSAIYDDVPPALKAWHDNGLQVAIYSSGSVLAQKLIFRYSDHGDLSSFISAYFDTNIGHKRDAQSYAAIAGKLEQAPVEILFVSDIVPELDAAAAAGLTTALSVRPGNAVVDLAHSYRKITSFDQLIFQPARSTGDSGSRSPG